MLTESQEMVVILLCVIVGGLVMAHAERKARWEKQLHLPNAGMDNTQKINFWAKVSLAAVIAPIAVTLICEIIDGLSMMTLLYLIGSFFATVGVRAIAQTIKP